MNKFGIVYVFVTVLAVGFAAQADEAAMEECKKTLNIKGEIASPQRSCVCVCIKKKLGIINADDYTITVDKMVGSLKNIDSKDLAKYTGVFQNCQSAGNGKKDMCDAATAIEGCVRTEANKFKIQTPELCSTI